MSKAINGIHTVRIRISMEDRTANPGKTSDEQKDSQHSLQIGSDSVNPLPFR